MTEEELKAIRRRCEKATPGPWIATGEYKKSLNYAVKTSSGREWTNR